MPQFPHLHHGGAIWVIVKVEGIRARRALRKSPRVSARVAIALGNLPPTSVSRASPGCKRAGGGPPASSKGQSHAYCCSTVPAVPKLLVKGFLPPSLGFLPGHVPVTSVEPRELGLICCSPSPDLEGLPPSGSLPRCVGHGGPASSTSHPLDFASHPDGTCSDLLNCPCFESL